MAEQPSTAHTAANLSQLSAGHRAWFWFCPQLQEPWPKLLITPLKTDPRMERLRADAGQIPLPDGAALAVGIANVSATGQLTLGGQGLSEDGLKQLATWVGQNIDDHPGLRALKDTSFLAIQDGRVTARHEDAALWSDIPDPKCSGTIEESIHHFSRLRPGQNFWFWMTDAGPGGEPFVVLGPGRKDTSGARFAARVAELERRCPRQGAAVRGVLRLSGEDTVVLTSAEPIDIAEKIARALMRAHPPLRDRLMSARLIQSEGGRFVAHRALQEADGPDLSRQSALLEALTEDAPLLFWFTDQGADGAPVLLLEADKGALREAARAARGEGKTLRGQLRPSKAGWLHFRTQGEYDGFVTDLAAWAADHHSAWPALRRLKGARLTQVDGDEQTVSRQRDDDAWERIP